MSTQCIVFFQFLTLIFWHIFRFFSRLFSTEKRSWFGRLPWARLSKLLSKPYQKGTRPKNQTSLDRYKFYHITEISFNRFGLSTFQCYRGKCVVIKNLDKISEKSNIEEAPTWKSLFTASFEKLAKFRHMRLWKNSLSGQLIRIQKKFSDKKSTLFRTNLNLKISG